MGTSALQSQLKKRHPFEAPEQETMLNLLRTTGVLQAEFERLFRKHGLSGSTYNILRILRGEADGNNPRLSCCEVSARLVTQVPDMTRLVDRLERVGLVRRERSTDDRRVILLTITDEGRKRLSELDQAVLSLHRQQLGHLSGVEMVALNELLVKARMRSEETQAAKGVQDLDEQC